MINKPSNVQITVESVLLNHQRPKTGVKIWMLTLQVVEIIEMFLELQQNLLGGVFYSLFIPLATLFISQLK